MHIRNDHTIPRRVALCSVLTALAAVAGYIEILIPVNWFGIPGVKLGLANVVSLTALYLIGTFPAYLITIIRVLIIGILFGSPYSVMFSMTGGLISLTVMLILKRTGLFSMTAVSAAGGVSHNIGQYLVAYLTLNELKLYYYIPVLIIAGVVCGIATGLLGDAVCRRLKGVKDDRILKGDG
ncbi:MAG: Gx transporter family protein [Lachnospiraceae bacterium]|nr:Gx transporter family protein [Lachnospiraceae bacterium]